MLCWPLAVGEGSCGQVVEIFERVAPYLDGVVAVVDWTRDGCAMGRREVGILRWSYAKGQRRGESWSPALLRVEWAGSRTGGNWKLR